MHTNKDDQTYMESIRTVIDTVLRYSDSDKKVEKLTGDPWEVEKCFKMMLSMAGFISYKLAKFDNEAFTADESVTNNESASANNSQASEVSDSKCDYSFDEQNVKEEPFDTEYPIDNIFKDLNSIFDSTIFDRVDQVEDNFDTTFVVHQDDDIEKLLTDDSNTQITLDILELNVLENVERFVETIPDAETKQRSMRKFRLKSSVEKSKLCVIRCE